MEQFANNQFLLIYSIEEEEEEKKQIYSRLLCSNQFTNNWFCVKLKRKKRKYSFIQTKDNKLGPICSGYLYW